MKRYLALSASLFLGAGALGYLAALDNPTQAKEAVASLEPIAGVLVALPSWQFAIAIFLNNALKSFAAMALGAFFGIVPAGMVALNGFLLGVFLFLSMRQESAAHFFAGTLPHGIVELPVFLTASALGFKLAATGMQKLFAKQGDLKKELRNAALFFAKFLLPLLVLAAVVEAFLTPLLLEAVL